MVKRYYIQDYPVNFRDNAETRTIASDFIRPSIDSSLTRRHVVRAGGFLQVVNLNIAENSSTGTKKLYMEAFDILPCYMMKFLCYSCCQL